MQIKLHDFPPNNGINSLAEWVRAVVPDVSLDPNRQDDIVSQVLARDLQGDLRIDPGVLLPHVVDDRLDQATVVVSRLAQSIIYREENVYAAIYLFVAKADEQVERLVLRLADPAVITQILAPELTVARVTELLR